MLSYLQETITRPILEQAESSREVSSALKEQVLERSHLSIEKISITIECLLNSGPITFANVTINQLVQCFPELQQRPSPGDEEEGDTERQANRYFQEVFASELDQAEVRIDHLIEQMKQFKNS